MGSGPQIYATSKDRPFVPPSGLWATLSAARLGHQHDNDHAPDSQERVAYGVRHGIAEARDLALGGIVDHAERCGRRPRARDASEEDGVVKAEQVLADK